MSPQGDQGRRPQRIGVIGLGYWGPHYLRILDELPGGEVDWVCDLDKTALGIAKEQCPDAKTTLDHGDMLRDPAIDAVVVATPSETHADIVGAALAAGKHVLCEKPLALTSAECSGLSEAAAGGDRVLMVGHTYIFNPAVRLMRQYVADGAIGRIRYLYSARTGPGPIRSGVNALWDLAPHDVAMALYILDESAVQVSAHGRDHLEPGREDVVFATLGMTADVLAHVHVSWLDALKVRRVSIVGDAGMLIFDELAGEHALRLVQRGPDQDAVAREARGKPYGEYRDIHRDGPILVPRVASEEPLRSQVLHFLACCRGESSPETDAAAAAQVAAVLEAATRSLDDGGLPKQVQPASA